MSYNEEIEPYRTKINRLNSEILVKIAERVEVAQAIADVKRRHSKPIIDEVRERAMLDQIKVNAVTSGLDPEGTERIFRAIIDLCVEAEKHI